jgi:hypothetical protein
MSAVAYPASRSSEASVGWPGGRPSTGLPRAERLLIGSSAAPRRRYCQRPVASAKRVGEHTGELE